MPSENAPQLSDSTIATVKATIPVLKEHGTTIVIEFYSTLFERYPEVRKQFNVDRQGGGVLKEAGVPAQVAALGRALIAYAEHIDNLEPIVPVVERICHKHVSRGVIAPQYQAVGECFIIALKSVLGQAATDDIVAAWTSAYGFLANLMTTTEEKIKAELEQRAGYSGLAEMTVVHVEQVHGGKEISLQRDAGVPTYVEGQFVSVAIERKGMKPTMTSVRLVRGERGMTLKVLESKEVASRYLLDEVVEGSVLKVSVPCGKVNRD